MKRSIIEIFMAQDTIISAICYTPGSADASDIPTDFRNQVSVHTWRSHGEAAISGRSFVAWRSCSIPISLPSKNDPTAPKHSIPT